MLHLTLLETVSTTPGQNIFNAFKPYLSVILVIVVFMTVLSCIYHGKLKEVIMTLLVGCILYALIDDLENMHKIGEFIYQKVLYLLNEIEKNK